MLMLGWRWPRHRGRRGAIIAQYRNVLDFNFKGAACSGRAVAGGSTRSRGSRRRPARRDRGDVRPGAVHLRRQRAGPGHGAARDPDRPLLPDHRVCSVQTGGTGVKRLPVVIQRSSPAHRASRASAGSCSANLVRRQRRGELPGHPLGRASRWPWPSGLNIDGVLGQISIGHSFFFGIGAYTTMILVADHGWPFVATCCRSRAPSAS